MLQHGSADSVLCCIAPEPLSRSCSCCVGWLECKTEQGGQGEDGGGGGSEGRGQGGEGGHEGVSEKECTLCLCRLGGKQKGICWLPWPGRMIIQSVLPPDGGAA